MAVQTGVLANCWIVEVACDRTNTPLVHVPLFGLARDEEQRAFYIELAADYPDGLGNSGGDAVGCMEVFNQHLRFGTAWRSPAGTSGSGPLWR